MSTKKPSAVQGVERWTSLRGRASAAITRSTSSRAAAGPLSAEAAALLLHELEVHQVELSMQYQEVLQARAAAEASSARYLDLFEHAPVGYFTCSEHGEVLEANLTLATLLGRDRGELTGRNLTTLVVSVDQDLFYLRKRELLQTGTPSSWELRLARSDGAAVWVRLDATLDRGPDGTRSVRAAVTDLTAARRADLLVHRLAAAVEHAPVAVLTTGPDGTLEYVNPAFEATTGYTRAEVMGRNPSFLGSGHHGTEEEPWETAAARGPWRGRRVNRTKAGQLFTSDVAIAPVRGPGGELASFVVLMQDVTHDLALQQQLVESQKLESLGRLAAGVAHDFNNLMAVVLLSADELLLGAPAQPALAGELAGEIRDAALRAKDLTRQLLAFSRQQAFSPVPVDLGGAAASAEKLLHRLLGEDITIEVRGAPGLWPARCDPVQLEQVILNLAINARDALPRGGRLTLVTSALPEGDPALAAYPGLAPGDYAQLSVADTGTGMPPEVLARIFDPFFTTKRSGKGTGLGLATVQGIVSQSGGAVRCESAPGQGTTFFLCLPRATGPVQAPVPHVSSPSSEGSETILLVEDDEHVRRAAVRILEGSGYRVLVAADGLAALELAAREQANLHLVVTDVIMPGMDGGVLAAELAARSPDLRVLFVSGYPDSALGELSALGNGAEVLAKPFTGPELLARVRRLLDGRKPAPG